MLYITVSVGKSHVISFESESVPAIGATIYVSSDMQLQQHKQTPGGLFTPEHVEELKRIDGQTYEIVGQKWEIRMRYSPDPPNVTVRLQARLGA